MGCGRWVRERRLRLKGTCLQHSQRSRKIPADRGLLANPPCEDMEVRRSAKKSRLAYSTETAVCRHCGASLGSCSCLAKQDQSVPDKITAKLRIEKAGRGGKTVTVVYDLPRNEPFLGALSKELKKTCGSGGSFDMGVPAGAQSGRDVAGGRVEVQGDHRDKLRTVLSGKGWTVKG